MRLPVPLCAGTAVSSTEVAAAEPEESPPVGAVVEVSADGTSVVRGETGAVLGAGVGGNSPAWYERNPTLREILDTAAKHLDDGRFAGEPLVLADLHQTLGRAYRSTGTFSKAGVQLQAAADWLQRTLGASDQRTVLARYELAPILAHLSRFDDAHALLDRADAAAGARRDAVSEIALRAH